MELVQVVVRRHSTDNGTELDIKVQTTPVGSVLAGAAVIWIGFTMLRTWRRWLWLPASAGIAMWALRWLNGASSQREDQVEGHAPS